MNKQDEKTLPVLHEAVVPIEMMLATVAKTLCSAVFVSGRDPQEAIGASCLWSLKAQLLPDALAQHARWHVDRDARRVDIAIELTPTVADDLLAAHRAVHSGFEADWAKEKARLVGLRSVKRSAQFTGGQGSLILPRDGELRLHFDPENVPHGPASSAGWPVPGEAPASVRAAVAQALEAPFADPDAYHAAVLVVHKGQIVGERYRAGVGPDSPLESWSMGKSTMGTLIGMLIGQGALRLDERAPITEWHHPGDPRREITLRHLLNMSSGLRCTGQDDTRETWRYGLPEHFLPYAESLNAAEWAIERPLEHAPDTVGRYRNCDPLSLAKIFRETVLKLGGDPLTWPQTHLFDRIGMQGFVLETDRWGHFIISGFDYGTARDWARLGLLYLNDGVWNGRRILPEGWVQFATAPAPAWKNREYGAQIWLNSMGEIALPADTYYFAGGGGQYVLVVPSMDLVVVRMGHTRGWETAKDKVNVLLQGVTAALAGGGAR
ncbi:serine hydrolase [Ramlibacter sp. G-1-2-2]|uniref:Serine hydrolase n=1 Tax=Ramlibacter agri TaxID=2728837 RepID=A0A848H9H9_9BURK|nr:serine hydrolase [Ramlibacter agri]NML46111.1 serine hydrolase [Ramlibacter agri]